MVAFVSSEDNDLLADGDLCSNQLVLQKWISINGKQLKIEMWEVLFSAEVWVWCGRCTNSRQNEPLNLLDKQNCEPLGLSKAFSHEETIYRFSENKLRSYIRYTHTKVHHTAWSTVCISLRRGRECLIINCGYRQLKHST